MVLKSMKLLSYKISHLYLFTTMMIEQFQKILRTPKLETPQILGRTQDLILCTFEEIFPQSFNLQQLHKIFQQVLGPNAFPSQKQITITIQQQISLNYRLVEYFVSLIKENFVNLEVYSALEEQTQRAEATIRSHIKIQQQMKMYLEYLQSKINKMQKQLLNYSDQPENLKKQILFLQSKETVMQRQKVNMIKRNEKLQRQIQMLKRQLDSFTSENQSVKNSHVFRKYLNELSTKHKNMKEQYYAADAKGSYGRQGNDKNLQQKQDKEAPYRAPGYDLTQKKKTFYQRGYAY